MHIPFSVPVALWLYVVCVTREDWHREDVVRYGVALSALVFIGGAYAHWRLLADKEVE